jgi:sugar (pentulose or hexulose) kinase
VTCSPLASGAPEVVLGIDLGTSAVKVLLADRLGTASYQVRSPLPGHAETLTAGWWRATCSAVRSVAASGPRPRAIAVTGQMHGTVLTRADGQAELPGPGWALLVLGTGGQWVVPGPGQFAAVGGGRYRLAGAREVGAVLDWVRGVLGVTWDELYATAARGPVTSPLFCPYPVPESTGITTDGGWTGLTLSHTREDLMSAALTGVARLLRDHLDTLRAAGADVRQVMVAGGGSRASAWRDLLSATFELPLHDSPATSLSVRGAAMIARYALRCEDPSGHHCP